MRKQGGDGSGTVVGEEGFGRPQQLLRQWWLEEEGDLERKSCTSGKAGEVKLWSRWRRTAMGGRQWLERKALVGHSDGSSGCQKTRAAGRGRIALWEMLGKSGQVQVEEDSDRYGTAVKEEGSGRPQQRRQQWLLLEEEGGQLKKRCTSGNAG